jgi:shikimate dehydrogenase
LSAQRAGVLGWPVAHSRSPAMHDAAYAAVGLTDWRYQLLPVPPELFAETTRALPQAGFTGANVTIPHKQAALRTATRATDTARAIGAANSLTFTPDGEIEADNTDAPGFLAALGEDPKGVRATVLGAGGSARAVVWALKRGGADVEVWNRTPERAQALAEELGVRTANEIGGDLLVSCIPAGADLPPGEWATVVDLAYGDGETPLVTQARRHGIRTVDGLEVLVRQGALSFERWTGVTAPLDAMRAAVRG